jgi:hypothetical protein
MFPVVLCTYSTIRTAQQTELNGFFLFLFHRCTILNFDALFLFFIVVLYPIAVCARVQCPGLGEPERWRGEELTHHCG